MNNKNNKIKNEDIRSLTAKITGLKFVVGVDPEVYDEDTYSYLCELVEHFGKEIWIDKTYVTFKGNIWKDAFIYEDAWNNLIGMIKPQLAGKKISKKNMGEISTSWMVVVIIYMYDIIQKYGFEPEDIKLGISKNCKMKIEYFNDTRTKWES